jgi:hypothetical protein
MKLCNVVSSNIDSIGHENGVMRVKFKNGGTYEYQGVTPEQFVAMKSAESVGKHLNSMGIKGKRIDTKEDTKA